MRNEELGMKWFLSLIACSLSPVACSLIPVACSLFPDSCRLFPHHSLLSIAPATVKQRLPPTAPQKLKPPSARTSSVCTSSPGRISRS